MAYKKVENWPIVAINDDGIRPAGSPNRCFYCHQTVGNLHTASCVTITKKVRYEMFIGEEKVGTYDTMDPHYWSVESCEKHKNASSWCKSNALNWINWSIQDAVVRFEVYCKLSNSSCACGWLTFKFLEVLDDGPFIAVPDDEEVQPDAVVVA